MPQLLIDTHCHLDLINEKGIKITDIIKQAKETGLDGLIQIATDLSSSLNNRNLNLELSSFFEKLSFNYYFAVGLHPCSAMELNTLEEIFSIAKENIKNKSFVALGETGLDFFDKENSELNVEYFEKQRESFEEHVKLAKELNLPLILHLRDDKNYNPQKTQAIKEAFNLVKKYGVRGVLHCYTYTDIEALPFVELGWFVSYSGLITFKNAKEVQNGAINLPLECLLVETDAPFLAPVPFRGKINVPAYLNHTLNFLTDLRVTHCGEKKDFVKETIYNNSIRFINLKN